VGLGSKLGQALGGVPVTDAGLPATALESGKQPFPPPLAETVSKDQPLVGFVAQEQVFQRDSQSELHVVEGKHFEVQLEKGERRLCVDINFHDQRSLLITKVNPGPVDDHNQANPGQELSPGDRIEAVNGIRENTQDMLQACKTASLLTLHVLRATERFVTLTRRSPLGMTVQQVDCMSLIVVMVGEGLVDEHNRCNPKYDIRREDRIIAVNGERGSAARLMELFESCESLELCIRRIWPEGALT